MPQDVAPLTFESILAIWPTRAALARALGVNYWTVQSWELRGNIPATYWQQLVDQAKARGVAGVTINALMKAAESHRQQKPPRRNAKKSKTS